MPDDLVARHRLALATFGDRVHAVGGRWVAPTPAAGWDVSDLVRHLVDEQLWVAPLLRGDDLEAAARVVDDARPAPHRGGGQADLVRAWDDAAAGSAAAVSADGALERTVGLSRGPASGADYVHELVFDLTVHAWDLGRAIGFAQPLPTDLVGAVWERVRDAGDLSSTGLFEAAVDVPDGAPVLDRLVALTGRDPR